MNTGEQGTGYVVLLPQDLSFMAAYMSPANWDGNPTNHGDYEHFYIRETANYPIQDNYASARVVGASIRVQYIGETMTESGLISGSHVFDSTLGRISEDVVENGYYITRGRPHEGMRLSYLPRDESDLEWCNMDYKVWTDDLAGAINVKAKFEYNNNPQSLQVQIFGPC